MLDMSRRRIEYGRCWNINIHSSNTELQWNPFMSDSNFTGTHDSIVVMKDYEGEPMFKELFKQLSSNFELRLFFFFSDRLSTNAKERNLFYYLTYT